MLQQQGITKEEQAKYPEELANVVNFWRDAYQHNEESMLHKFDRAQAPEMQQYMRSSDDIGSP